ncbi:hypothetical protein FOA52_005595 [Chlamydomonas sp. UWO 241]|nr:hypothetical protein FOA52_005595 [Chlamydomonas sp. UWO 241]
MEFTDDAPLSKVYTLFRTLGLRHLLVVPRAQSVVGVITRQDLLPGSVEERFEALGQYTMDGDNVGGLASTSGRGASGAPAGALGHARDGGPGAAAGAPGAGAAARGGAGGTGGEGWGSSSSGGGGAGGGDGERDGWGDGGRWGGWVLGNGNGRAGNGDSGAKQRAAALQMT